MFCSVSNAQAGKGSIRKKHRQFLPGKCIFQQAPFWVRRLFLLSFQRRGLNCQWPGFYKSLVPRAFIARFFDFLYLLWALSFKMQCLRRGYSLKIRKITAAVRPPPSKLKSAARLAFLVKMFFWLFSSVRGIVCGASSVEANNSPLSFLFDGSKFSIGLANGLMLEFFPRLRY